MAAATEALVKTDNDIVLAALKDNAAMESLATKAKKIAKSLVKAKEFDINDPEDRAEIKRIGRRVGKTAKDVNDCGVAYLRNIKSKIKEVEKRKKWFADELEIVRASVEKPVKEWEQVREDITSAISRFQVATLDCAATEDLNSLLGTLEFLNNQPETVVDDLQGDYSDALQRAIDAVTDRIAAVKKAKEQEAELERLRKEKAETEAKELERLRKENETLKSAPNYAVGGLMPSPMPAPASEPETPVERPAMDHSLYVQQLECLCVDLYNEFATGDAYFTGEMKRLDLLADNEPF